DLVLFHPRPPRRAADDRSVDHRPLTDQNTVLGKLTVQLRQQRLYQPLPTEGLAEPPDRRMVGRLVLQRQPGKAHEAHPDRQRSLRSRVGQTMPAPQQQNREHHQRRVGSLPLRRTVDPAKQHLETRPVTQPRQRRQSIPTPIATPSNRRIQQTTLTNRTTRHQTLQLCSKARESKLPIRAKVSMMRCSAKRSLEPRATAMA